MLRLSMSSDDPLGGIHCIDERAHGRGRVTRRQWLRISALAGCGWAAAAANSTRARSSPIAGSGFGRAKSVVLIFASGGQSQIDMWDPKPQAPLDVRGAFQPIATSVPGVQVCEHMPQIARIMDRVTLIRCMSHEDLDHGTAAYLALTGRYHTLRSANPPPSASDFPTMGAVLRRVLPAGRALADAVHLNGPVLVPQTPAPGQYGGLLGRGYEPLVLGDVRQASGASLGLTSVPDLPTDRLADRWKLKQALDRQLDAWEQHRSVLDMNRLYRQAFELLASPGAREAFRLEAEPDEVRNRYGRNRSGQACLLARRLVEAGVPYINVIWNHSNRGQDKDPDITDQYGWDTHNDIFDALRGRLLPRFDQGFSALIEDLNQRGLLEDTLVVCMGEFGRAPRVALERNFAGSSPGRKHWASVYSLILAGAGVQRGAVVGASDRMGAYPVGQTYGPWDVAATIFHALGIDPHQTFADLLGRPLAIAEGRPIRAAYG